MHPPSHPSHPPFPPSRSPKDTSFPPAWRSRVQPRFPRRAIPPGCPPLSARPWEPDKEERSHRVENAPIKVALKPRYVVEFFVVDFGTGRLRSSRSLVRINCDRTAVAICRLNIHNARQSFNSQCTSIIQFTMHVNHSIHNAHQLINSRCTSIIQFTMHINQSIHDAHQSTEHSTSVSPTRKYGLWIGLCSFGEEIWGGQDAVGRCLPRIAFAGPAIEDRRVYGQRNAL